MRSLAAQQSVKAGTSLTQKEMQTLIDDLFACASPNITFNGKPVYTEFNKNELDKILEDNLKKKSLQPALKGSYCTPR
ncbi:MAG: hypothetical protein WDM71_11510 [Ferruginibacter sp.]